MAALLFACTAFLHGLEPDKRIDQYGHDVWTSQRGLPGEAVYQIMQSLDGYLWLRTSSGLVRFDGVRFVSMDSAVGSEPIKALAMSASGDLLVRTTSRTAIYKSGAFADYRPVQPLPDGEIKSVFESRQHEVLIGADDFLYLGDTQRIKLIQHGTEAVSSFLQDETGKVWVGASTGLATYHAGILSDALGKNRVPPVFSLLEDSKRQIWVGAAAGLYRLNQPSPNPLGHRPESDPSLTQVAPGKISGPVNAIAEDRSGNLWVGTTSNGLFRRQGDSISSFGLTDGLSDNRVLAIFEDREGSLWVGTGSGLDRFRNTKVTTYTTYEGLPSNTTRAALRTRDGSIYVICDNGGLARIKDGVITATREIPGIKVFNASSMTEDKDGSIWIGNMQGLVRFKDGVFTAYGGDPRLVGKFIPALAADEDGLIYSSSDTVTYRFKDGKVQPFTVGGRRNLQSGPGNYAFAIYHDPAGTLWFGTEQGLSRYARGQPPNTFRINQIQFPVTSISDDGRGSLWLGGRTPGLTRFRISDRRITHYKKIDGLFDDYPTRALFDDDGNPWISTSNGIYSARRKDMDDFADGRISTVPTVVYGIADGMKTSEASTPSAQPGGAIGPDGRLWFTTSKGIVAIDPRHLPHNALAPPVVVENVVIDNATMPASGDFQVPPGKDKLEFHYTALSFVVPERVRFKYQLEGYDRQWVDAGPRRVAYYNNLSPGHYRFKVIAANDDGVWNDVGASIGFEMKPHFYQTHWFQLLCGLLIILAAIAGHRINTRIFRRRALELNRLVEERTAELRKSTLDLEKSTAELQESKRHLEQVAFLDSLTGLPNRRMFTQQIRKMLAMSKRTGGRFTLVMIDLDQFKRTNDTMGHDAGDALLIHAAGRLKAAVRETDCVARLGGDEFAVLIASDDGAISVDLICRRILDNFVPVAPYKGAELKITPSIGVATFPDDGETDEALCKAADIALYKAKGSGGNCQRFYHQEPSTHTVRELTRP